jgi:hypothetical protein
MAKRQPKPALSKQELIALEIESLRDKDGNVHAADVVERAKKPESILHGEFEWNVALAAQQAWEARAKELIRACRDIVVYGRRTICVPVYVSDPRRPPDRSYMQRVAVASNDSLKRMSIRTELERVRNALQRAYSLALVYGFEAEFERWLREVEEVVMALGSE